MTLQHFATGRIGALDFPQINEAFDVIRALESAPPQPKFKHRRESNPSFEFFDAVILNAQEFAPNRWEYAWEESVWDSNTHDYVTKPGGRKSTLGGSGFSVAAYNDWEVKNTATTTTLGLDFNDYPNMTITVLPIADGTPVLMRVRSGKNAHSIAYTFAAYREPLIECGTP